MTDREETNHRIRMTRTAAMRSLMFQWTMRTLAGVLLALFSTTTFAQNSMIGDGFGGRLWYRPTNYTVGSYSAFSLCYSDPCDSSSNQLYGWGVDANGELGNGPGNSPSSVPVPIAGMTDLHYFTTGYCMAAIKNDGTGWVWGLPYGVGFPIQVITDVISVDASAYFISFTKNDGTVWSIGDNQAGQFGDGSTVSNYAVPVQMTGVTNAVRMACGILTGYVLLSDSTVLAVGSNHQGLLGDPLVLDSITVNTAPIAGLSGIVDIKAHSQATAALSGTGEVYCWGNGGSTGDGDMLTDTLPKLIASLADIIAISGCTDGAHFLALDANKNCYRWGIGSPNGLPELVATDVIDIMAGETFSYIVRSDGSLWAQGSSAENMGSIWLNLTNTDSSANLIIRPNFTQLDPSMVPGSCLLQGSTAFATATCGSGIISVYHFGGQPPYQYDIGNGPQASNVFTDVPLGNYTVSVTDANGCVITVPCTVVPDSATTTLLDIGTVNACAEEGFALPSGTTVFTSGNYSDTTYSVLGCDTARLYDVVIDPLPGSNVQITLCQGEAYMLPSGVDVFAPGTYVDTVAFADACDSVYTFSLILSTLPPVVAQVATPDSSIAAGDTVLLSPSPGSSYSWYPSTGLSCTACTFPLASPTETTEYCVVVSDSLFSCGTDTACLVITVIEPPPTLCTSANIFVPSAFSPDVNGKNDQHCVRGTECIASMSFSIYNRWGEKVFETTDPEACWDGTNNGQALDPAVFVYHLSATLANGELVERQGNITLVR